MKLSVCMIVKNEELSLGRILECVKKFADEIVIVDTGSTDHTIEIAQRYTKKVFSFEWVDDFSIARNYSFSKAECDYIMWLDADDYITPENIEKILRLKEHHTTDTNIFMCRYSISFDKDNKPVFSYYRERIVKNSNHNLWQGFIHEAIILSGKIEYTDIEIEHRKQKSSDPKRNLKIYNKHIRMGEKFNTRSQYYYVKELFYNSFYDKCIKEIKKYIKMDNKYAPNFCDAIITLAKCYIAKGDKKSALDYLIKYIPMVTATSEYYCMISSLFIELNLIEKAILFYHCALNIKPKYNEGFFVESQFYNYIPLLQLSVLYYESDYEKAKYYNKELKRLYPDDNVVISNQKFFEK